jgi:hypothetical protein
MENTVLQDIPREIATDLVAAGEAPVDFHDVASAYVESDRMDERLDGLSLSERLGTFEPTGFDINDWLDTYTNWGGADAIYQIQHGMFVTAIRQSLQTYEDNIELAVDLHHALDRLADEQYLINDAPNYTELVHDFYSSQGELEASGINPFPTIGLDQFNETHVRGLSTLDPTDDDTLSALHAFFTERYPKYAP